MPSEKTTPGWRPIGTEPRDGTWFLICQAGDPGSVEAGCFDPMMHDRFEPAEGGLYRKVRESIYDWHRFNNFGRATHWMPLPPVPEELT